MWEAETTGNKAELSHCFSGTEDVQETLKSCLIGKLPTIISDRALITVAAIKILAFEYDFF